MARRPRHDPPGGWHHVMNRGIDRAPIFFDDTDRLLFERVLADTADSGQIEVHACCLMTNHFHLLVHCPDGGISDAMQRVSSTYTRALNDRHHRDGPIFRGRFHSVLVTSDRQVVNTAVYIHRNPIDIVPARAIATYRWSTLACYVGTRPAPTWLTTTFVSNLIPAETHRRLAEHDTCEPTITSRSAQIEDALAASGLPVGTRDHRHARDALTLLVDHEVDGVTVHRLRVRLDAASDNAIRMRLHRARRTIGRWPPLVHLLEELARTAASREGSDPSRYVRAWSRDSRAARGRSTASP